MSGATERTQHRGLWHTLSRRKGVVVLVAAPILLLLWFLFRPEKLFINERVNEPAPFGTAASDRVEYLGKIESVEPAVMNGRASIIRRSSGERILRIPALATGGEAYKAALSSAAAQSLKPGSRVPESIALVEVRPASPAGAGATTQDFVIPPNAASPDFSTLIVFRAQDREILARAALEPF